MTTHHYTAYGLHIASELECPELLPGPPDGVPDVTIVLGELPERIERPRHVFRRIQVGDGEFQLEMDGVARYRASAGRQVIVAPFSDSDPSDVRLFLLGTVLGGLLHQLGRMPLHCSAVAVGDHAVAFCGHSGAGKSTLATALHRLGYPLLCDDVGVVVPDGTGSPWFYPGFPRIKLWREALEHFTIDHRGLTRDWTRSDKYHLRIHDSFHQRRLPLRGVFLLERGDRPALEPLAFMQAVGALVENTYRPRLVGRVGDPTGHFRQCTAIAGAVRACRYVRPWTLDRLDESLRVLTAALDEEVSTA